MAIYNVDDLILSNKLNYSFLKVSPASHEAAGILTSMFYFTGIPGQSVANAIGKSGESLTYAITTGCIPFSNPPSGQLTYLGKFAGLNTLTASKILLLDRLWHNSGITVTTTTEQFISSYAWPSRCPNITGGTVPNASGYGVQIGIEWSVASTNGAVINNCKMKYTNSDGVIDRIAYIPSIPATPAINTFIPFILASGDTGVKQIQSITLGTSLGAGTIHLVAFRQIAVLNTPAQCIADFLDPFSSGMPQLFDNSCLFLVGMPGGTTASTWMGEIVFLQK